MLKTTVRIIQPDDNTMYLVGIEGLVWVRLAIDEPAIIAARNAEEQAGAALYIASLLQMGLVPRGLPINHKAIIAMFGGGPTRDCEWVPWELTPAPAGDPGDGLPTKAAVFSPLAAEQSGQTAVDAGGGWQKR